MGKIVLVCVAVVLLISAPVFGCGLDMMKMMMGGMNHQSDSQASNQQSNQSTIPAPPASQVETQKSAQPTPDNVPPNEQSSPPAEHAH